MSSNDITRQRTVADSAVLVGIGLHGGGHCAVRIGPAPAEHGIRLHGGRAAKQAGTVQANWREVVSTAMCTTLGHDKGARFSTVEHLLAALSACGVDNALLEVTGGEIPIMDGSAAPFVAAIRSVGTTVLSAPRRVLLVRRPVVVCDGDAFALVAPSPVSRFTVEIDFPTPAIGHQTFSFELDDDDFMNTVAGARTFGFAEDLHRLHRHGLALAGSIRNAVVIEADRICNPEGLRFADEFARHKLLDLIGDAALAGRRVHGHFYGHRSGHRLNTALLRALMLDQHAWSLHSLDDEIPQTTKDRLAAVLGELGGTQMAVTSLLREIGEDTNETCRHERSGE